MSIVCSNLDSHGYHHPPWHRTRHPIWQLRWKRIFLFSMKVHDTPQCAPTWWTSYWSNEEHQIVKNIKTARECNKKLTKVSFPGFLVGGCKFNVAAQPLFHSCDGTAMRLIKSLHHTLSYYEINTVSLIFRRCSHFLLLV